MTLIEAYFDRKKVPKANNSKYPYDGRLLDVLFVSKACESRRDVEELIEFLNVHRFCFKEIEA